MPAVIDTPEQLNVTLDAVEIVHYGIGIRPGLEFARIVYDRGHKNMAGEFVPVIKDQSIQLTGLELQQSIVRAEELASLGANVYSATKSALYEALLGRLGMSGTLE